MKNSITTFIFDMDGVIFDSERLYIECCAEAAEALGMKNIVEVCHRCIGVTTDVTRAILISEYGDAALVDRFTQASVSRFKEKYSAGELRMKPGVIELLKHLEQNGYRIALASSTRTDIVSAELRDAGIIRFFDEITGGDQVSRSKPNPDIFLHTAEKLGEKPDSCVVIEDSFNGIRAAKAANMTALMVPDQLQPDEEVRALADSILESLFEVIAWEKKAHS